MDGPYPKRLKTSHGRVKSDEQPFSPFDVLPDEMLAEIFRNVDSVTRRNMENVCSRWRDVLRDTDTHSLRKVIKIDVGILPPDTLLPLVARSWHPSVLLSATVGFFLNKYPDAHTLHFTDAFDVLAFDEEGAFKRMLESLNDLVRESRPDLTRTGGASPRALSLLIFDRLKLNSWCMTQILMDWEEEDPQVIVKSLFLHEVTLCGFTLEEIFCRFGCPEKRMDQTICRKITCSICHVANRPMKIWEIIALLGQNDRPLNAIEEVHFHYAMRRVRKRDRHGDLECVDELADLLQRVTGKKQYRDDILSGAAFPPFWKRLLIGGKKYMKHLS